MFKIESITSNARFVNVYSKVFDEKPTFRSFTFLNYIEEKGLGDLSVVFTKAKELKHQIRIRNIMDFFFNYENIEQIYEKELELELAEKELSEISKDYQEFNRSLFQAKKLFRELHLPINQWGSKFLRKSTPQLRSWQIVLEFKRFLCPKIALIIFQKMIL